MTNTLDSTPPPPAGVAPAPPRPAQPTTARTRNAGHIVAIIVGCLLLVPGLGMAAGGAAAAIGQAVATDDDGYFRFTLNRIETTGVAIATTDLWLDDVDLRLRVDGAASTDDVFVGIARSADLERYLDGAAYSEVIEVNDRNPRYQQVDGNGSIDPPLDQDFWTASAAGTGEQQLDWEARGGRWSVVVMNSDGSPVVAADVEIGARSGAVTPVAISLLVMGGLATIAAAVLIVVGARGRRSSDTDSGSPNPLVTPLPPLSPQPPPPTPGLSEDDRPTAVG
jgi:hypothetical protein